MLIGQRSVPASRRSRRRCALVVWPGRCAHPNPCKLVALPRDSDIACARRSGTGGFYLFKDRRARQKGCQNRVVARTPLLTTPRLTASLMTPRLIVGDLIEDPRRAAEGRWNLEFRISLRRLCKLGQLSPNPTNKHNFPDAHGARWADFDETIPNLHSLVKGIRTSKPQWP